jgi:hypothetical protein
LAYPEQIAARVNWAAAFKCSSVQHCSVQFVMPCFLGLQRVMYFTLHSIIGVPFHAVWILLGVKNISIQHQCYEIQGEFP